MNIHFFGIKHCLITGKNDSKFDPLLMFIIEHLSDKLALYFSEDIEGKIYHTSIHIIECWLNMPLPVMSIFQGSEDLQLDTSLQHLEEDEAEEDQERRNKEVLKPIPFKV